MLKIRLKRVGRKRKPIYKIVLMESLSKRNGKSIADFGYYNPLTKTLNVEKVALYKVLKQGAYPTNTMRHLLYRMLKTN